MAQIPLNGAARPLLSKIAHALRRHGLALAPDCKAAIESPAFLSICAKLPEQQALFAALYVATYDLDLAYDVCGLGRQQITAQTKLVIKAGIASRKDTFDLANHELAFELAAIAMANLADIPPEVYQTGDVTRLPRSVSCTIKKIKPVRDAGFEVELHDKLKAIALLDKMFGQASKAKENEQTDNRKPVIRLVSSGRYDKS